MKKPNNMASSFYMENIDSCLPEKIIDFHTHIWMPDQWKDQEVLKDTATDESFAAQKYMTSTRLYPLEQLKKDGELSFPGKKFSAVCFGMPTPSADVALSNDYVKSVTTDVANKDFYPLMVAGTAITNDNTLSADIVDGGFYGYKVYLDWIGNDYGNVAVSDMLSNAQIALADKLGFIVLLHVPGGKRLADPAVLKGVIELAKACPNGKIVLAHCGRCYHPLEMRKAVYSLSDLENVYMDCSMVMDSLVIEMAIKALGYSRVLFATDFPIAIMRGRRVNVADHWIDIVGNGYPDSDYRIAADDINTLYMSQEIALAVILASDMCGLTTHEMQSIFYDNAAKLLQI